MQKKTFFLLISIFIISILSVFFWYYLQEKKTQAHFYLNLENGQAEIYLNNKKLSSPPIKDYQLPGGWYELKIVTPHYSYISPLRLTPQTATIVDWKAGIDIKHSSGIIYELNPITSKLSELEVITLPDRGIFQLSASTDKYFAPHTIKNLMAKEYTLHLDLPGYDQLTIPLTLHPAHRLKLTIKLAQSQ